MEENTRISDLFERARTEAPKTSFEDIKGHFLATSVVVGTGFLAKWLALSFKLKVIIMVSVASLLTISSLVIVNQFNSTPVDNAEKTMQSAPVPVEIIEVRSEDGVQQTITYNEKQEVINITIDSSAEVKADAKKMKLDVKEAKAFRSSQTRNLIPINVQLATPKSDADSLSMKKFMISEKTTKQEIENIRQQALDAGLEFTFDTKIRSGKIKRLNLQMKKDNKKWMSKISGTDSFSFEFGWWEDKEGNFVKYLCDDDLARICGDC